MRPSRRLPTFPSTRHHDAGFEGPEEPAHLAVPSAAELKGLIRDWRKGRATRNLLGGVLATPTSR